MSIRNRGENNFKISLLSRQSCVNIESFKLIYNKETVVKLSKIQEDVKMKIKLPFFINNTKMKTLIPTTKNEIEDKGTKIGKMSKIMTINNRVLILIHDVKEGLSKTIFLYNTNIPPSRYHCWDRYLGYFYIYDNMGKIMVYIGNIKDEWGDEKKDDGRKLCELSVSSDILNPILYLLKISRNESVLLVIGGYSEKANNKIFPIDKIFVFHLCFSGGHIGSPTCLFSIKMKYGRISPMVCKQKCDNEKYLLIIGGNNLKKIKKKNFLNADDYENFKISLEVCESVSIEKIKEAVFKHKMNAVIKINMENSLKIDSNHKTLKKIYSFSQGAVVRIKTGKVGEKEKTNFFIGVGSSKRSLYFIDYFDYKHCSLHISKAETKYVQLGLTCSEMAYYHEKRLYYLIEDNNEKGYKSVPMDFGDDYHHRSTKCSIF